MRHKGDDSRDSCSANMAAANMAALGDTAPPLASLAPEAFRKLVRAGGHRTTTAGVADGFAQCNLVVLPSRFALDFLVFCQRNPKPCPLLDVTDRGSPRPVLTVRREATADLRTDLPRYRVYEHGQLVAEETSIEHLWSEDSVGFLLGCSFSFEAALEQAGLPVRHLHERNADGSPKTGACRASRPPAKCRSPPTRSPSPPAVPMYKTSVPCVGAGPFQGPMVVSMRPYASAQAIKATEITARYPRVHGAPVHLGDPAQIGIRDLSHPDFGDPVTVRPGEVPVFWACGVTPQAVAMASKVPLMITHAPGCMFVTDLRNDEL
jgi:uncharacterized protein YcsI (UPF0317 family)